MYSIFVTIDIQPEHVDAFIEASVGDAQGSTRDEPGCFRFDMHQDAENPARFYLYEVYRDVAAFEAHLETPALHPVAGRGHLVLRRRAREGRNGDPLPLGRGLGEAEARARQLVGEGSGAGSSSAPLASLAPSNSGAGLREARAYAMPPSTARLSPLT